MIDDSTQDYDDMFAGLSDDIMKNIYIRFYSVEEYYELGKPETLKQEGEKLEDKAPLEIKGVTLFFNKAIQDTIHSLFVMNKLIHSKAKLVNSVLENGFEISTKKNAYWNDFLEEEQFIKIKRAYQLITNEKRLLIKYIVLSLSNILLKLSINMSKVSIIPLQKFLTFECLNIPILSIIFLQFLEYRLLAVKKHNDIAQDTTFLKQMPKISVVKLGKYKNNSEIQLLENSQHHLFTNKGKLEAPIKNLQFLEIHEYQQDPIYPNFQRKTKYQHIKSFCLQKISKKSIKTPFTFQILFLMETLIHPLIREFRPDTILYIESYPADVKVMDEQIRGLMISQLVEETECHKIYVFKELGFDKYEFMKQNKLPNEEFISEETKKQMEKLQQDQSKKLKLISNPLTFGKNETYLKMKKIKKILLDDLCFIALALIQKTSFDNALDASHRHFYPKQYLLGLSEQVSKLKESMTNANTNENFYRTLDQKIYALKNMKQMLIVRGSEGQAKKQGIHIINLMNRFSYFDNFYDLQNQENQKLQCEGTKFTYGQEDYIYVKYFPEKIFIFIVNYSEKNNVVVFTILSKDCQTKHLKIEKSMNLPNKSDDIQGAIYIASDKYLYRGFGKFRQRNQDNAEGEAYNTAIHRFKFLPEVGQEWELVGTKSSSINPDGVETKNIQLEKKRFGYGIYDPSFKNVMFMGGYLNSQNQEKISTKIYLIKNSDDKKIFSIGKTNKILFKGVNDPINKIFLHPFVFGIPFQEKMCLVLNSNGNFIHLNNSMKIFATQMKISSIQVYNGIVSQAKLKIHNDDVDQASAVILIAELLNKLLVSSPYQINNTGLECCIQTLDEGCMRIKADPSKNEIQVYTPEDLLDTEEPFKISFI